MTRRPIIIVGSGPAGAAAALFLQQRDPALAGETLVLEKARHPRAKVCAGGLIPHTATCLRQLELELSVPHVTVHAAQVTTPRRTVAHEETDLCTVVRRDVFDASLVRACRARGVEVREEEPVVDLRRDGDGIRVVTRSSEYHARLLIGADGSGSVVRRRLVDGRKAQTARAVMCDVPLDRSTWSGFGHRRYDFDFADLSRGLRGYRWAFPCLIDGVPHVNVGAYSLTPSGAALNASLERYLSALTASRPRWQAYPIRWYRRGTQVGGAHVLLAGDAAGVDPLMGEGISVAMEYGNYAATAAIDAFRTGDFSADAYRRAIESSWFGKKLRRLHVAARLFYGPTWRVWFAVAERSTRARAIGLRWYNGVDGWDQRSGWAALRSVLSAPARG